ncbi:MAG TPA: hypothetical protein VJP79_08660 [Nitrososphaera sp.]|nr:hypothetical protein [Nitrososphaera sp.]
MDERGRAVNTCDPAYAQITTFGIISSLVGALMFIAHLATKRERIANTS